jgi:hypothetical protein
MLGVWWRLRKGYFDEVSADWDCSFVERQGHGV